MDPVPLAVEPLYYRVLPGTSLLGEGTLDVCCSILQSRASLQLHLVTALSQGLPVVI